MNDTKRLEWIAARFDRLCVDGKNGNMKIYWQDQNGIEQNLIAEYAGESLVDQFRRVVDQAIELDSER